MTEGHINIPEGGWSNLITVNNYISYAHNNKYVLVSISNANYESQIGTWSSAVIGKIPIEVTGQFFSGASRGFVLNNTNFAPGSLDINGTNGNVSYTAYNVALAKTVPIVSMYLLPKIS